MTSNEIRKKFIEFFESKRHVLMPSSSLIPKDDPSVLITTAGMQQFKKWFSNEVKPAYKRTVTIQKCVRTNDIEEIGDETHLSFFEMLGNFSFGDYFKKEAIEWGLEFIEKELKIDRSRIWVSIFAGDDLTPRDNESEAIWRALGIKDIREYGRKDNFWGPTGTEGACGPTSEIYVDDVEVWNLVFNEYYMQPDGVLLPLKSKGVDTGAGLERVTTTINKLASVYDTDELIQIISLVQQLAKKRDDKAEKIITDHLRGAIFMLADGIRPSNLDRGYVLRRVIRRAIRYGRLVDIEQNMCTILAEKIIGIYQNNYPQLLSEKEKIISELNIEELKFSKVIEEGTKKLDKLILKGDPIAGVEAFDLFSTYGFPFELTKELAQEKGIKVDQAGFETEFEKHQEISKGGLEKKFAGGLENKEDPNIIKLHTAAHLMLAAMREILGASVHQKGSNITTERLRFDFSYPEKLSEEQKKAIEDWVNEKIARNLEIFMIETDPKTAKEKGAEGEFDARYGDKTMVYSIGGDIDSKTAISKEICGGPHAKNTSELGQFRIKKEESSSAGVRRIKAVLE